MMMHLGNYSGITSIKKNRIEITERNDGFIDVEDPGIWFSTYKDWLDVEKKSMKYVNGTRVLDIGCGTGKHALYLQKEKGFGVFGIDTSPLAIRVCKLLGLIKARVQSIIEFSSCHFWNYWDCSNARAAIRTISSLPSLSPPVLPRF